MQEFVGYSALALLVLILGIYLRNMFARTWDLLSWRNLFLLGYIHFYCLGTYHTSTGETGPAFMRTPDTGWEHLGLTLFLFFGIFMLCATFAFRRPKLGAWLPKLDLPVTAPGVVTCAVVLAGASLFFAIPFFNYFGLFVAQVRGQLAACAVGLATYYLISRRFNPAAWAVFLGILGVALVASTVGTAGRRMLLSVMLALPWMLYFGVWRYRSSFSNLGRVSVAFAIGVLGLLAYSPMRASTGSENADKITIATRAEQFVELFTNPKIDPKVIKFLLYTDTAGNTLWIIVNYPSMLPYEPFQGLKWFVTNPIPRTIWPNKPAALGATMSQAINVEIKNFSFGPGIIGHGWSEGWYIGVVGYAAFFGLLIGAVDRRLFDRAWNPYLLATLGSCLGNVFAMPRGDTPLFLLQITGGVVVSTVFLGTLNMLYGRVWAAFSPLVPAGTPIAEASPDEAAQTDADPADMDGYAADPADPHADR